MYIYISNEEETQLEVFFDDFKVDHIKSPVVQMDDYYPFGLTFNSYSRENTTPQDFKYNGKELQDELNLQWLDYGARMYDPAIARWMAVDPLTELTRRWSPYTYCYNNPLIFVDPDGMFGDLYNSNGTHIGNDGLDDNKVYHVKTTDDSQLSTEQARVLTGYEPVLDDVELLDITHEEFQQFAANVYNEAPHESSEERDKVASAIVNRKETHSLGGSWEKTLDRVMFAKDSHEKKMSAERANPEAGAKIEGTKIDAKNVKTENYQEYYNATPTERNGNARMKDATRATISGLTQPDKVSGANEWRGKGQGNGNRFFKEKK